MSFVSYETKYIQKTILVISYLNEHFVSRVNFLLSSVRRWPFFKKYGLSIFIYLFITCIHDTFLQYLSFIYYCIKCVSYHNTLERYMRQEIDKHDKKGGLYIHRYLLLINNIH